ncbi:MAG: Lrp/AsnC family transcriptional regulator [Planctomycetota bacterium]|nr:Lrp/AsnC family transcriptional regulator [Planctomycetota bacterium]MDI6787203.1 Lrp/AsnC family transcriptional regulator [Planctomycetota bacterium]
MVNGAYVGVNIQPELTKSVYQRLTTTTGIRTFKPVTGRYDAIVYLEGLTPEKISSFVVNNLRAIRGVTATETFWVLPTTITKR